MSIPIMLLYAAVAFGVGVTCGCLLLHWWTERTRAEIAVQRQRARDETAAELQRARTQIAAKWQRAREEIAAKWQQACEEIAFKLQCAGEEIAADRKRALDESAAELQQARVEIVAERQRAQTELDSLDQEINHRRGALASLRVRLRNEARGYRERFAEFDRTLRCLCKELEEGHPAVIPILTRTPAADTEVINFIYYVNDRWKKINDCLLSMGKLAEAGIVGSGFWGWSNFRDDGPQSHLSAQWRD